MSAAIVSRREYESHHNGSKSGESARNLTKGSNPPVRVRRTREDRELRFSYAGIETYEKRDGRWVKVVEVGTFEER